MRVSDCPHTLRTDWHPHMRKRVCTPGLSGNGMKPVFKALGFSMILEAPWPWHSQPFLTCSKIPNPRLYYGLSKRGFFSHLGTQAVIWGLRSELLSRRIPMNHLTSEPHFPQLYNVNSNFCLLLEIFKGHCERAGYQLLVSIQATFGPHREPGAKLFTFDQFLVGSALLRSLRAAGF